MATRLVGVLTLRGEGASPRVIYSVDITLDTSSAMAAAQLGDVIADEATMSFTLNSDEHGHDALIVVRTENIYSLIVNPSNEDGHEQR